MARVQSDVCIIGGGITGTMAAAKLSERSGASITMVEAGAALFDLENRFRYRQRSLDYGENAWPGDFIPDQAGDGIISRTMAVGGSALHWGGTVPRFGAEDFRVRSMFGVGYDWPITYDDLEPFYCEGERRMGVAGEVGNVGEDHRSEPYPMPPHPLNSNLRTYRDWASKADIPFWTTPSAKNTEPYDDRIVCQRCDTCIICPTGAKYSPDFTVKQLLARNALDLRSRTLIRRLEVDPGSGRIVRAHGVHRDTLEEITFEADTFILAAGYAWSCHLLLLSADARYPDGLANSSGLLGRHMAGHRPVTAMVEIPEQVYPGVNGYNTLVTRKYMRPALDQPYIRHDLRIFESTFGRQPRIRDDDGRLLLGDALMTDWQDRARRGGAARVRGYYDVIPAADSRLTLDPASTNGFGDAMPRIEMRDHADTDALRERTEGQLHAIFDELVAAGGGRVLATYVGRYLDHPCGGARMGTDPTDGVTNPWGRTWDHDNLWVVGAPTCVTGGCTNGTNTFVALTLRSVEKLLETV